MSIEAKLDELATQTARDVWALEWSERDKLTPLIRAALAAAAEAQRKAICVSMEAAADLDDAAAERAGGAAGAIGKLVAKEKRDLAAAIRSGR